MAAKIQYTNCRGDVYYVRRVEGKHGVRYACVQKESTDNLEMLPDGFEFAENPNGQVSCRPKLTSLIHAEEVELAQALAAKLATAALVKCELKEDEIIVHSTRKPNIGQWGFPCAGAGNDIKSLPTGLLRYDAILKFQLSDETNRIFTAFRMTWMGECEWMYPRVGTLEELINEYAPHIERESFFELR